MSSRHFLAALTLSAGLAGAWAGPPVPRGVGPRGEGNDVVPLPPRVVPHPPLGPDEAAEADARLLRDCKVGTDGPALLDFFRKRTLTDADRKRLAALIEQLGSDHFREREAASRALAACGEPARPLLRTALANPDREIAARARRCLEVLDRGPGADLPAAAARQLARRPPPGAVPVLLAYLPQAEEDVADEVFEALASLGNRPGPPDPALRAAVTDPQPLRRAAAGYALGRSADPARRAPARGLLADRDVGVRWRAARGLLAGRDRSAVPALIALVAEAPAETAGQVEEVLIRLAGEEAPDAPAGDDAGARARRRDAWRKWWEARGDRADLAQVARAPRHLGLTLIPEMHAHKVWECGRDGKPRWELTGVDCPIDAEALPGGRVLVAELGANRVTERDARGKVLWQHAVPTPIACQRLANGHTFIATNQKVFVVDRQGREVSSYQPEKGFFIHSARRLGNGHMVCLSMDGVLREVTAAGKAVRSLTLPTRGNWSGVEGVPGGHYLAVNNGEGKVLEVDATGKAVWDYTLAGACYAARLPNGHTLVVSNARGVVEVDRRGKVVWERRLTSSLWRAHRR